MKSKLMRTVAFIMVMMTTITANPVVFAAETVNEGIAEPNGLKYQYKTEYFPERIVSKPEIAGNQPEDGVYLESPGDSIYYVLEGGVELTFSTNVELPEPYDNISFTVTAGSVSGYSVSGYSKELGDNPPGYYVLEITKNYNATPYVVYRKHSGAQYTTWTIDHTGCVYEFVSARADLVLRG